MKDEQKINPIHLKFDYNEALNSKRELLYSQKSLMIMTKTIQEYYRLKNEEVEMKAEFHKKLRETIKCISKLQKTMPSVEIPEILKKDGYENKTQKEIKIIEKRPVYDNSVESQLREIQEKLMSLQN